MQPVLLEIGPLKVHSYGLMIAVGFLVALRFMQRDAVKRGIDPKVLGDMAFVTLFLGLAGTRVAHIIMFPSQYSWSDPLGWIAVWRGGLVFQGAIPPAFSYVYYCLRKNNVPFWPACDVMFPFVPLGHGIGRLGCFFNGCCYGRPSDVAWAIPAHRVPWDMSEEVTGSAAFVEHMSRFSDVTAESHWSHPVHPTQLYSFLGLVMLCGVILFLRKRWNPFPGFTVPAYLVLYGVFRFIVEFFRGDHNPVHVLGLSDQQVFSLVFAGLGVVLFVILRVRLGGKPSPESGASAE